MATEKHLHIPDIWNVPLYNESFIGRDKELLELQGRLNTPVARSIQIPVAGLPGIGKSQTVKKMAHDNKHHYRIVWWINAETQLEQDYLKLAQKLHIPIEGRSFRDVVTDIKEQLRQTRDWMLIFDNVENPAVISEFFPDQHTGTRGHIIITLRDVKYWSNAIQIGPLQPNDAIDYLLKVTEQSDRHGAAQLAKRLGYFPLALSHAAGYIFAHEKTFAEYLTTYDDSYPELAAYQETLDSSGYTDYYRKTIRATFVILFNQIRENPASLNLLFFCSFLSPDNIPKFFLESFLQSKQYAIDPTMVAVHKYAILQRDKYYSATEGYTYKNSYSLHRLVQEFITEQIPEDMRPAWLQCCVSLADQKFKPVQSNTQLWQQASDLISHIEILLNWVDKYRLRNTSVHHITAETLEYCLVCDLLEFAEKNLNRLNNYLGPEEHKTKEQFVTYAKYLINSVSLLIAKRAKGVDYQAVIEQIERLIMSPQWKVINERIIYEELKYYLGVAFYEQQKNLDRSEQLQREALAYFIECGDERRQINSLSNLGALNQEKKNFDEAVGYFRYALMLHQRAGYIYPNMGYEHNALGAIYKDEQYPGKDIAKAKYHLSESIKECERFPTVSRASRFAGWAHYSLALIYSNENNYDSALTHGLEFIELINRFMKHWPPSYIECLNTLGDKLIAIQTTATARPDILDDTNKDHKKFVLMQIDVLQLKLNYLRKSALEKPLDKDEAQEVENLVTKLEELKIKQQRQQMVTAAQQDASAQAMPKLLASALPVVVKSSEIVISNIHDGVWSFIKCLLKPLQQLTSVLEAILPERNDLLAILRNESHRMLANTNASQHETIMFIRFVISHLESICFYCKYKYGDAEKLAFIQPIISSGNEILLQMQPRAIIDKAPNYSQEQKRFAEQTRLFGDNRFVGLLNSITGEFMRTLLNQKASKNIFISYAWPIEDIHSEQWTKLFVWRLAIHLMQAGQKVTLDQIQSGGGMELHLFMNKRIREADHVLVICDRTMKFKFEEDAFTGACFEYLEYIERYRQNRCERFIIPVCLNEENNSPGLVKKFAEVSIYQDGYLEGLKTIIKLTYGFGQEFELWWKAKLAELKLSDAALCESFGIYGAPSLLPANLAASNNDNKAVGSSSLKY